MSTDLIGIIAKAISLGTARIASLRSLRQGIRDILGDVKEVPQEVDHGLESRRLAEMHSDLKRLTARITNLEDRLSKVEVIIEGMFWSHPQPAPRQGPGWRSVIAGESDVTNGCRCGRRVGDGSCQSRRGD